MTLGGKLQALRKSKGISQEQLAAQLDVSRQAVSKWELGESLPDITNIIPLSKLFEVSTDYLLKDDMEIETPVPPSTVEERGWRAENGRGIAFMTGIFFGVIGLLASFVGWSTWQTIFATTIGIFLQIIGIASFEAIMCGCDRDVLKSERKRFYLIECWLIAPFPVKWLIEFALGFYPKPYSYWIALLVPVIIYLIICGTITILLRKKRTSTN